MHLGASIAERDSFAPTLLRSYSPTPLRPYKNCERQSREHTLDVRSITHFTGQHVTPYARGIFRQLDHGVGPCGSSRKRIDLRIKAAGCNQYPIVAMAAGEWNHVAGIAPALVQADIHTVRE